MIDKKNVLYQKEVFSVFFYFLPFFPSTLLYLFPALPHTHEWAPCPPNRKSHYFSTFPSLSLERNEKSLR